MTWGGHTFVQIPLWCLPFSSGGSWAMGKWSDEHSQSMSLRLTSYWSTTDIATWKCLKEISIGTCNKQLDIYVRKRDLFKSFDTKFPMNFPVEKFIQLKILKDKGQSNRVRVSASPRRPRRRDCTAFQRLGATRRWKGTWRSWRSDSKDRSPRPRPQVMYFIVAQGQQDPPFSIWAIVHQWWTRRSKHRRRGGRPACRREGPGCDHRRPPRTDSGGSPPACPSCGCSRGRWWSGRPCELCSGSPHSTGIRWMIPLLSCVSHLERQPPVADKDAVRLLLSNPRCLNSQVRESSVSSLTSSARIIPVFTSSWMLGNLFLSLVDNFLMQSM